jgi:membrane-associated phospholipid phosphatase
MVPSLYVFLATVTVIRGDFHPFVWLAIILGGLALLWRLPASDYRLGMMYILGFAVFNCLRIFADDTGRAVSFNYPADFDAAVFGTLPTTWLQDRYYTFGHIGVVDSIAILTYASYFKGHYIGALLLWIFKRDLLKVYIVTILGTLYLGLICYYLLPTSPPWLAYETGHVPEVFRIFKIASNELWHGAVESGTRIAGTNDVGAMPSLHTALTAVIALFLWRTNRIAGLIGWAYVAMMGFSLVYLGEHYVIDVIAGIGTACVALVIAKRLCLPSAGTRPRSEVEKSTRTGIGRRSVGESRAA